MDAKIASTTGADAIAPDRIAYTVAQTAELLSVSSRQVYWLLESGQLVAVRVGRAVRITRAEINRYLADAAGGAS